jgi:peptidylprolyl isomerase
MSPGSRNWCARDFTTASCSTASSRVSWRRPAVPQGTGTGGSGQKLKAEFNKEPHVRGTTSMARAASPDSGDSQFFICFDDASFLNGQYTVWGKVTSGMENVDKIKRGEPVQNPDKIVKAHMAADAA